MSSQRVTPRLPLRRVRTPQPHPALRPGPAGVRNVEALVRLAEDGGAGVEQFVGEGGAVEGVRAHGRGVVEAVSDVDWGIGGLGGEGGVGFAAGAGEGGED